MIARIRHRLTQQKNYQTLSRHFEEVLRDAFSRDARRIIEELFNDRNLVADDTRSLSGEVVHSDRPVIRLGRASAGRDAIPKRPVNGWRMKKSVD